MPRFFVSNPIVSKQEIVVSGREARHMQRVLRLKLGDKVDIFDGTGKEYRSEILRQDNQTLRLRILETTTPNRESPLTIIMGQSLVKGNKMDFIIQKATELGVSEVFPFVSSRSITYLDKGRIEHRVNRWRRIAVQSSKQCGRLIPLRIEAVAKFEDVLERASLATKRIILWEKGTRNLTSLFRERNGTASPSQSVYFLVGPEGGFSEEEIKRAEGAHFVPVGLGSRILRVETAGLSFVSILQYEWGDLR